MGDFAAAGEPPLDRAVERSISLLKGVFGVDEPRDFTVRFWNGAAWGPAVSSQARFTLVLRHPGALRRMLWRADELTVGEAYLYDDVDVEGDIAALVEMADQLLTRPAGLGARLRAARDLLSLPGDNRPRHGRQGARLRGALHSRGRDRQAIAYHYDVSNDFFALWLDRRMVYSCAYFPTEEASLDTAQERKLEHICRKLRLRPGERLLDIGCGWGALVIHAAQRHGVEALGITLSRAQAELANRRIEEAGLAARCRVECRDYRDLADREAFDKIASVGMFEHVGEAKLPEYFGRAWTLLRPGGAFLNHGIAFTRPQPVRRGPTFFDRYVFPDGELVALSATLRAAESGGFEVRDVESLREHYALTLRHWLARLEERHAEARRVADEVAYRVWRLYMALAVHQFTSGRTTIYQTLLSKPDRGASGLPLTRADWYG